MSEIEIGLLSFVPKGYVLTKDGEKFGGNTRIFAITNRLGKAIKHWHYASSTQDGKTTFVEWFKKTYPKLVPPFRGDVFIFRAREAPSN